MNQETFLIQLERLLSDIPEDERREALEYYRCYFEDAGVENEASVIEELVSPERVAQTIKADLQEGTADGGFTENGYEEFTKKDVPGTEEQIRKEEQQSADFKEKSETSGEYASYSEPWEYSREQKTSRVHEGKSGRSGSPVGKIFAVFGICIAVAAVVIGMVAAAIAVIVSAVSVGGVAVGLMGAAIGCLVTGAPAVGLVLVGVGLIMLAIFFLLLLAVVAVCGKAFPSAIRGICGAAENIIYGRGRES